MLKIIQELSREGEGKAKSGDIVACAKYNVSTGKEVLKILLCFSSIWWFSLC